MSQQPSAWSTPVAVEPGKGVGPIKLAMKLDAVTELMGNPDVSVPDFGVYQYSQNCVALHVNKENRIVAISCGSRFPDGGASFEGETPEGVGIGFGYDEIKLKYGAPDVMSETDSGVFTRYIYERRGIAFSVGRNGVFNIQVFDPQMDLSLLFPAAYPVSRAIGDGVHRVRPRK